MEVGKVFHQYDNSMESSDSDSDVSFGSLPSKSSANVSELKSGSSTAAAENSRKKPTRCPDPTVYNRNALLARENRRRKKAYLETIEKDLEDSRAECRVLKKTLKKQQKAIRRLEQEKCYFQSIVTNRTGIINLIAALNSQLPLMSPSRGLLSLNQTAGSPRDSLSSTSCRGSRSSSYDPESLAITINKSDNGSLAMEQHSTDPYSLNNILDNFSTDFEPTPTFNATWNELLEEEFGMKESTIAAPTVIAKSVPSINSEHSYVSLQDNTIDNTNDSGVCLHIAYGKVSLEFCPSCHWNSCQTPPRQLLQDNAKI